MPPGREPSPDSATRQLASLGIGDCFSRANVIPAWRFTPEVVLKRRRSCAAPWIRQSCERVKYTRDRLTAPMRRIV
jgi:hypothetical protein